MNTRSLDLGTRKQEGVAYISGLSRWRWAQADPLPDSRGLHSRPRSPTRYLRCWRFWPALKQDNSIRKRPQNPLYISELIDKVWPYSLLRCLTYDANPCTTDTQAISWLMICAWVLSELCNNMPDHLFKMHWILKGCKWALKSPSLDI